MVKLTKLVSVGDRYTFDSLLVNPADVSIVEENHTTKQVLSEDKTKFPEGLGPSTRFSTLKTSAGTYVVVGDPDLINEKLQNRRTLLKG